MYAMRNALLPVVTIAGVSFGHMFGWALIIEQIFNISGMSRALLTAINQRDYYMVQTRGDGVHDRVRAGQPRRGHDQRLAQPPPRGGRGSEPPAPPACTSSADRPDSPAAASPACCC